MRILFVASEVNPFAKTGGLADVASALPAALRAAGHDVITLMPLYGTIDVDGFGLKRVGELTEIALAFGPNRGRWTGWAHEPTRTILADIPDLYGREYFYGHEQDEPIRWAALNHIALQLPGLLGWQPHVIHCNDWQTGLIPLLIKARSDDALLGKTKTVHTIHNLGYQGRFGSLAIGQLGFGDTEPMLHREHAEEGYIGFLETGLTHADAITTVSPTYANEIKTPDGGAGLDWLLTERSDQVSGILNGIDTSEWDPNTDELIPATYSADDLTPKSKNTIALMQRLGLSPENGAPVVGIISRLAYQKGIDLMETPLRHFLTTWDLRVAVLGSGEEYYESMFEKLATDFPEHLAFHNGYDNELAHLIEAGADIFLMPSLYEPSGLNQMYSLVYGTVPVVRSTGGLADTVTDVSEPDGTGFVFEHYTEDGLGWALGRALDLHTRRDEWTEVMQRGMRTDFSWAPRADEYTDLYETLQ